MKKLVLVYPNMCWLKDDVVTVWDLNPTTLLLLAAMVEELVEVEIVDAQFHRLSEQEFQAIIAEKRPDFVGISLLTSEYHAVLEKAAHLVKAADPGIVVIAGGVHVTTMTAYVMRDLNVDYGVVGEGEFVLPALMRFLLGMAEAPPGEGLAYRMGGKVIIGPRAIAPDLGKLPWPNYGLVDYAAYLDRASRDHGANRPPAYPCVRLITTRGCPFGCTFCQVENISGKKVRPRDPDDVVNELQYLKDHYGIRAVIFDDDNMLMAKGFAKKLFSAMIERDLGLQWIGTAFALFLLNAELADLMRRSGCVGLNVAVESGSARVLKQIVKKPIKDLARVPGIIQMVKDHGMWVVANFIIGFPGETWGEIRQTIRFAEHCNADYVKFFSAIPLSDTKLFHMAKAMDAIVCNEETEIYDWRYSHILSDEWTQQDIAILRAYEWDRINFSPERLPKVAEIWGCEPEKIEEVRKRTRDALFN